MNDRRARVRWGAMLMLVGGLGSAALLAGQEQGQKPGTQDATAQTGAVKRGNAAEGDRLFHEKGCSYCHGANAAGTARAPSLEKIGLKWDKARIERQIREGGLSMPAFGEALDPQETESLVEYLSLKRGASGTSATEATHKATKGK